MGRMYIEANASHGIRTTGKKNPAFNSLAEIPDKLVRLLLAGNIKIVLSRQEGKLYRER